MPVAAVDELPRDAHAITGTADAPFEDVADAELMPHLADVW
jgi:hypothetical protein